MAGSPVQPGCGSVFRLPWIEEELRSPGFCLQSKAPRQQARWPLMTSEACLTLRLQEPSKPGKGSLLKKAVAVTGLPVQAPLGAKGESRFPGGGRRKIKPSANGDTDGEGGSTSPLLNPLPAW